MDTSEFLSFSPNSSTANLRESVRLLEDSFRSRNKSIFRISSSSAQRRSLSDSRRDHNISGETNRKFQQNLVLHDLSLTLAPEEIRKYLPDVGAADGDSWKSATDRLYVQFLESLQAHGTEQQVFEIIEDHIQTCSDTLELLRTMEDKTIVKHASKQETWLENERNTWRLVYCLYQNRINTHLVSADDDGGVDEDLMELVARKQSEKETVQQLYKNDNVTRECQLVIDWLEQNASDARQDEACIQHFTDKTVSWENTLHQLQNHSANIPYGSSRPIVSRLDFDAPLRENKPLHDIDAEDEARILKEVFIHIRCGRLEQAQTLCMHIGQEWRAAALEGWRLHHDPNYIKENEHAEEKLPVEGNPNRDIWKLVAWQMAEDKRLPIYARATFAALSGHLPALIAVCQCWEDLLWAYLRVLVDIKVEKEIRASSFHSYVQLPEVYWNNEMNIEDIFSELAANKEAHIQKAAMNILHKVQQYLIMDQIGLLMEEMEQWIKSPTEHRSQSLRFLAHLVLFLRFIGRAEKDNIGNAVLQAYVKELMQMRDPQLVAHYVATLPQDDQILLYAEFLADITESSDRELALSAAEDADLDIETITKAVVENIRNMESDTDITSLQTEVTNEDLIKVSALDWVVHYPLQRAEAIWQANALIRHFLALSKLEAASKAFNKIPADSIDLIMKQYQSEDIMERLSVVQKLPFRVSCSIREFLCYKAYLDAHEGFSDWFEHYHHAKPVEPKLPPGDIPFTERVAFEHHSNRYKTELERWKMSMQQQTKTVKNQLYNVLTFPEGGWLIDSSYSVADDEIDIDEEMSYRQKQMADLRQLCIPKVTLLLHTVMHQMEEYAECIQLADLIVSEQHKLYKVFTKSKLGELLGKISESSLALLDQKHDPWGASVSS